MNDSDRNAIQQAALDYVASQYAGDAARLENCLHPQLVKRRVVHDSARQQDRLDVMSALELIQLTREGVLVKVPPEQQQQDVFILDIDGDKASVKVIGCWFVDYMHLARCDGRWQIIHALWDFKPEYKK